MCRLGGYTGFMDYEAAWEEVTDVMNDLRYFGCRKMSAKAVVVL